MKVVMFSHKGKTPKAGILEGDQIIAIPWLGSLGSLIESGITPGRTSDRFPLAECKLLAPLRPGKILCIGRNYAAHAAELGNQIPAAPMIFAKFGSSVIGVDEPIVWDQTITQQVDWEGELAVVIGKRGKYLREADVPNYLFGYTIANDVSARDLQDSESQWTRAKSMDTFCPLGPCIVTKNEIPDPQNLRVITQVNGETMQDGLTAHMLRGVYDLVAYCSQSFTLEPGDVILTGTPSGVGKGMTPPRFLQDSDTVSITIEPIGTLTNPCQVMQS
ncbi:MAG: fumarylacetoacetate hydrolase family protein [Anaerolineae bacterium]|jgi:5-carboxymethyl-2-hydroxymuconate isomerase|nr:fumarylacetoacetate hydrolase family protein [Anaerolineae bacterium]